MLQRKKRKKSLQKKKGYEERKGHKERKFLFKKERKKEKVQRLNESNERKCE